MEHMDLYCRGRYGNVKERRNVADGKCGWCLDALLDTNTHTQKVKYAKLNNVNNKLIEIIIKHLSPRSVVAVF